jgi:hypothetical protein
LGCPVLLFAAAIASLLCDAPNSVASSGFCHFRRGFYFLLFCPPFAIIAFMAYETNYPTSIPDRTDLPAYVDNVDDVEAKVVNDPTTELIAALTELGTLPKGSAADVASRLAVSLNDDGSLKSTLSPTFVDLTLTTASISASYTSQDSCLDLSFTFPSPAEDGYSFIKFGSGIGYLMLFGGDDDTGIWQCGTTEDARLFQVSVNGSDIWGWGNAASGGPRAFDHFEVFERALFSSSGVELTDYGTNYFLQVKSNSNTDLTDDRILTIDVNNDDRSLVLHANLTVESASVINQDVSSDNDPTFDGITLTDDSYIQSTSAKYLHLKNTTSGADAASGILSLWGTRFIDPPTNPVIWELQSSGGAAGKLTFSFKTTTTAVEKASLDLNGDFVLVGDLAVNGGNITTDGDLTITPAGHDVKLINSNLILSNDDYNIQFDNNSNIWVGRGSAAGAMLNYYNSVLEVAYNSAALTINSTKSLEVDNDTTAGNTRFLLYDNDSGSLVRVSVGADDSGGSGYKLLRVPN